jgi:thiol:disulfide interchange protein DsbA
MSRFVAIALAALIVASLSAPTHAARTWREGTHYTRLHQPQRTSAAAGKVEVMEVFSYGCPACNSFEPVMHELKASLPGNAQMVYLPASFKPEENWPLFQRAYFAAQSLGIAERTHQAIYDAVWKTGQLAVVDRTTNRLKRPQASLQDVAKCYGQLTGVKPETFIATAKSFGVDVKMKAADAQVEAMEVPGTPCIVVNGKYRVNLDSLGNAGELVDLVKYLVAQESPGA